MKVSSALRQLRNDRFGHACADSTSVIPRHRPPYRTAGAALLMIVVSVLVLIYMRFQGALTPSTPLTVLSGRSGLSMEIGSKVTYNGVQIGRVGNVEAVTRGGATNAKLRLDIEPEYANLIPANVSVDIAATTLFGNKHVAFSSPRAPSPRRVTSSDVIDVSTVTTEFDTLFETLVSVTKQVDPIKLNQTLSATAQALDGLGERFGQSLADGDAILADLNGQMPRIRTNLDGLADLADTYAEAGPDLFDALAHATTTAHTLSEQQSNLDSALMASLGFADTAAVIDRASPYFVRGNRDGISTTALLDEYSPSLFCMIRNYHDIEPKFNASVGGNGYSVRTRTELLGVANPYVYPDNLPRTNAHGGPEGRPGCWAPVTRDLWPMPYLVMDTGASIAPCNHLDLGQPVARDYVWGRQIGQNTINP
jgi:phospholipid/cholesterol/gamma-HCH transport system substrate-binding protein